MVRQDGYNIIIEMKAPPRDYGETKIKVPELHRSSSGQLWSHRVIDDDHMYRYHIECVKREITEFAKNVFAKEIGKDITREAVKCVDEVVRQTLK